MHIIYYKCTNAQYKRNEAMKEQLLKNASYVHFVFRDKEYYLLHRILSSFLYFCHRRVQRLHVQNTSISQEFSLRSEVLPFVVCETVHT